jgi:hypothetical protein
MLPFESSNFDARERLLSDHPLVKKSFLVVTPTIEWAYSQIRDTIWLRMPSMYFNSDPRMGKTQCAGAIVEAIKTEFNDRYVQLVAADNTAMEGIVTSIANNMRLVIKPREKPVCLRDRLLTHIECELASICGSHFVLVIDEMQSLRIIDYQHLQVIQNRLSMMRVCMTTIGFAQTEINSVRTSLLLSKDTAIVGRFLSERVDFMGCENVEWLKHTLLCFDESLIYPANSGCSYTNFFLPAAFQAGFRLHHSADLIYDRAAACIHKSEGGTIPVAHLFSALAYLLVTARLSDANSFSLDKTQVDSALRKSGMGNFASLMGSGLQSAESKHV